MGPVRTKKFRPAKCDWEDNAINFLFMAHVYHTATKQYVQATKKTFQTSLPCKSCSLKYANNVNNSSLYLQIETTIILAKIIADLKTVIVVWNTKE